MRVMEWNVHGLASNRCPTYVADEIKKLEANIVVLTEYVENANYDGTFEKALQSYNYSLFRQPKAIKGNGVLIAVKQNSEIRIDCCKCIYSISDGKEELSSPNFLQASIEYLGKPITIIGLRVNTDADYLKRWKQVEQVLLFITNLPEEYKNRILVMGDFNNSQIKGVENDFNEVNQYIGFDTEMYNLQMIKKAFKEAGFYVSNSTPKGNV